MANKLTSVFSNIRDNLSKFEGALVSLIGLQAVVGALVEGVPQVARYVDGAFAAVVVLSALVKNFLANTAPPSVTPPAARKRK
jgi:hypothetical protein